ncbi:Protein of unknown function [Bacillus mobilis]|nr:Protein of unknown function [Bacillus mobilis]
MLIMKVTAPFYKSLGTEL